MFIDFASVLTTDIGSGIKKKFPANNVVLRQMEQLLHNVEANSHELKHTNFLNVFLKDTERTRPVRD